MSSKAKKENNNTTGAGNMGIGTYALYTNTTGAYNVGIGTSSLFANQTGNYNVGIGMAYVQTPHNKLKTDLVAIVRNKKIALKVKKMPFVAQNYHKL